MAKKNGGGAATADAIILTNGDVLRAVPALEKISGGHTDATELKIMRLLRKLRPVADDLNAHLRKVLEEYQHEDGDGTKRWKDAAGYSNREKAILAEDAKEQLLDVEPFERKHFKKLPAGVLLAELGPLFKDTEDDGE